MEPLNSLAASDVRSVIPPFTDLAHHVEEGPLLLSRGEGVYVIDDHEHNSKSARLSMPLGRLDSIWTAQLPASWLAAPLTPPVAGCWRSRTAATSPTD